MRDIVIVGGGPAAITAAIYAARQNADVRVIAENIGGQAALSAQIENYTGFQLISGGDLIAKFISHAEEFGIDIKDSVKVVDIKKIPSGFSVVADDGECCRTRSVIIASGSRPRKLNVSGEDKFIGKGLAYCAVCEAPLYRDKRVLVIGGGNSALDAARQLAGIAEKVYILTVDDKLSGEPVLREKVMGFSNTELVAPARVTEIRGEESLSQVKIRDKSGERLLAVEGVFVEIGWEASSDFINIVKKNNRNEIIIDINNRTDIPGVFAAGDVTSVSKKQVIVAAGSGASAALNAIDYLSILKED